MEKADHLQGSVLLIGFGRFGQVVSHSLLARGIDVSIIDIDTEMIRSAADFGFKVYYGDGNRLDVLHASGAGSAKAIIVCIDKRDTSTRIARLVQAEFPLAELLVRSYDREHALSLVQMGVHVQVRETFDSAMTMGEAALAALGVPPEEIAEVVEDVRRRDAERFKLELVGGEMAGVDLLRGNMPRKKQTPLTPPKRPAQPLSEETAEVTARVPRRRQRRRPIRCRSRRAQRLAAARRPRRRKRSERCAWPRTIHSPIPAGGSIPMARSTRRRCVLRTATRACC